MMRKLTQCLCMLIISITPILSASANPEVKINNGSVIIAPGGEIDIAIALCSSAWPTYEDQILAVQMAFAEYGLIKGFLLSDNSFISLCDQTNGETWAEIIVANDQIVGVIGPIVSKIIPL